MKFPNKYLRNLKPYKVASHKVWSVSPQERCDMLKLDWNESTIPPSPSVLSRIKELLEEPNFFNLYPATNNSRLLQALSLYVNLPTDNIQYFASSDALHEYICKVFISVGDPVMILGPSYDNFRLTCQANGADVFFSYFNDDFTFDSIKFEQDIISKEPAVVYICNPNNPTGYLHAPDYIEYLLREFPDTLFLVDEAYYEFSGVSVKDLVLQYDNLLVSRTMSKAFGLANFRVGYLIASKDNIQFVNKVRNPKNISTLAQESALAALCDVQYMNDYVEQVHKGMDYFINELSLLSNYFIIHRSRGNFLLIQFPDRNEKNRMLQELERNNIFVRDTTQSVSVLSCFRITIGTVSQMERVVNVIKLYYANLSQSCII